MLIIWKTWRVETKPKWIKGHSGYETMAITLGQSWNIIDILTFVASANVGAFHSEVYIPLCLLYVYHMLGYIFSRPDM